MNVFDNKFDVSYVDGMYILVCVRDSNATKIMIPSGIDKLNDFCFLQNYFVEEIYISDTVKEIGDSIFETCSNLKTIFVDKNNEYYEMRGNCLIEKKTNSVIKGFGDSVIPSNIVSIKDGAFFNCSALKHIDIPSSVKYIGENAFSHCKALESITFNGDIDFIGDCCFSRCESLKDIKLPNNIKKIGIQLFAFCSSLESIDLSNIVAIEKDGFFCCSSLKNVKFSNKLKKISDNAFNACAALKEIRISKDVIIGDNALEKDLHIIYED